MNASESAIYFELDLPTQGPGRGATIDGTIFWNCPQILAGVAETTDLTISRSIVPAEWLDFGVGNLDADPLFVDPSGDFRLRSGSAA